MATTPTQLPVPSETPRDLKFNAGKIDEFVTGDVHYYTDRFGKRHITMAGMHAEFETQLASQEARFDAFIERSGYQVIGDYVDGPLTVTEYNQLIRYGNELWKLNADTDLPYTTAGTTDETWNATDSLHFVSVGDGALRQQLATPSRVSGDKTGGSMVATPTGATVDDALPDVYLPAYGVLLQPASTISNGTAIDMSDKLQEAINEAKRLGVGLVTGIRSIHGPAPTGYVHVTKSFDVTRLKSVSGFLPIGVIPETFTPTLFTAETPSRGMVMRNMNARYDSSGKQYAYSTEVGPDFDSLAIYALRDMPENIIGMVHTTAYNHFHGQVWARRFATGIYLANTYDVSIAAQWAAVDCGSMNYPPLMVGSYPAADVPDESNSITFPDLLLHSNKYRDAEIVGSKINVNRIHGEACVIGSLDGMVPRPFDQYAPKGIASLVIASVGGCAGNIDYNISKNSTNNGCLLINVMTEGINTILCDRPEIDTVINDIYYLKGGGHIGVIKTAGNLYTGGGSKLVIGEVVVGKNLYHKAVEAHITNADVDGDVENSGTINNLTCKGSLTEDQYGKVNGGSVGGNVTMTASGKLTDVTINGDFITAAAKPRLTRVTVNGQWRATGGGEFYDCTMPGFGIQSVNFVPNYEKCNFTSTITAPVANSRAVFNNCRAPYNFDNAVNPDIRIYNGSSSGLSMENVTTGAIVIDGLVFTAGNSIRGWSKPVSTGAGYGAKTINPYTGKGWMLLDYNSAPAWLPINIYQ